MQGSKRLFCFRGASSRVASLLIILMSTSMTVVAEESSDGSSSSAQSAQLNSSAIPTDQPIYTMTPLPASPAAPPLPFAGSLWERPYLLGDAGGLRDQLVSNGLTLNVSNTNFYQGVAAGGILREFAYSGRNDYYLNVNGEQAGLWKGLFIDLHGETRWGDSVNGDTGALLPVNTGALFPVPTGTPTALTALKVTQALSEEFMVFGGKINMIDGLTQNYAAGRGVDAFMNIGLALPMVAARTIPYSTLGGGFAYLKGMEPIFTFMVVDTNNTPTTTGFQSFFNNGATMLAMLKVPVTIGELPGHQGIAGTYSTGTYSDLTPTPYFNPSGGLSLTTGTVSGSWSVFYSADQALYVDPCNPKRSWGLFTNIGFADNGPSPIQFSANAGVGGSSPIVSRPLDTFGVGYSFVDYSGPVKNAAPILFPVQNDHAVEFFYNYAVTPWFRVTPDLQIIVPARERTTPPGAQAIDTALVLGLRAKIDF